MKINFLETPCLLLETRVMEKNFLGLSERLQKLGVTLRSHMKTVKSIEVANALFGHGHSGVAIAVSTLKEAEEFAKIGITDMVYAVGVSPNKLQRIRQIRAGGVKLKVILDSVDQANIVSRYVQETNDSIEVLIEIDCDEQRSGLKPNDKDVILSIAKVLRDGGAVLQGVLSHSGGSYLTKSIVGIIEVAEQERQAVVKASGILRQAGYDVSVVSVGSTPTAYFAQDLTGITEVRAGVFMFFDLVMEGLGACATNDIAISVLTTVIGHQVEKGWIIVDAGWMAMSRDRGTAGQKVDQGYGLACDENGKPIAGLTMISATQEHGVLAFREGNRNVRDEFPIGTMLRILPNHACATAAQYQEYQVIENHEVIGVWSRFNGW